MWVIFPYVRLATRLLYVGRLSLCQICNTIVVCGPSILMSDLWHDCCMCVLCPYVRLVTRLLYVCPLSLCQTLDTTVTLYVDPLSWCQTCNTSVVCGSSVLMSVLWHDCCMWVLCPYVRLVTRLLYVGPLSYVRLVTRLLYVGPLSYVRLVTRLLYVGPLGAIHSSFYTASLDPG